MPNFPTSVSTNNNLFIAVDGLQTTLAASITNSDTTITLLSTSNFPTTGVVTVDNAELVIYAGISGSSLTGCTRGAFGSMATAHSTGVEVGLTVVAAHHNLLKDEIIAIETALQAGFARGDISAGSSKVTVTGGTDSIIGPGVTVDFGTVTLDDLSDVVITSPSTNDILQFNGTSWVNTPFSGVFATVSLDNLSSVAINTALLPGMDNSIALGSSSKRWTTLFGKDVKAGASGTPGTVDVFPSTASKGKMEISAADNSGDTTTTITNASQSGARTYTVPDAGTSASFVMTEGTQTINGSKTIGSDLNMGSNKVTALAAGALSTDAANVSQLGNSNNILDNGGFNVWQRGTSFSNPVNGTYSADRWFVYKGGTVSPTVDVSQDTGNLDTAGTYAIKMNITSAGSGGNVYFAIVQDVERHQDYTGKTLTISARVKTTMSGVHLEAYDGVTLSTGSNHSGSGNYETLTLTKSISSSATSMSWYVGLPTAGNVTTTGTIYMASAMLAVGPNTVPYIASNPEIELARCQRYFVNMVPTPTGSGMFNSGMYDGTNTYLRTIYGLPVTMRTTPTVSVTIADVFLVNVSQSGWSVATATTDSNNQQLLIQVSKSGDQSQLHGYNWGYSALTASADI